MLYPEVYVNEKACKYLRRAFLEGPVAKNLTHIANGLGCAFAGFLSSHLHYFSQIIGIIVDVVDSLANGSGKGDNIFRQLLLQVPVTNAAVVVASL